MFNYFVMVKCQLNTLKICSVVLIVALIISIGAAVYFGSTNIALTDQKKTLDEQALVLNEQNEALATRLEMVSLLTEAQVQIDTELRQMGRSLVYACEQLSMVGLEGDEARTILSALVANSSFIIDACTFDLNGTFVTMEPTEYRYLEGTNVTVPYYLFPSSHDIIVPYKSTVENMVEGFKATSIMGPVYGSDGSLIGSVSVIFDQSVLINATAAQVFTDMNYALWAIQTDGLMIYEINPEEIYTNLFNDPYVAGWDSLQAFAHQLVVEPSGYGTYEYYNYENTSVTVIKQAYWTTVGPYGTEWRLVITNVLPD